MTIHSVAGPRIKVKDRNGARIKPGAKPWQSERFGDLIAVGAAVLVLGGTYLLVSPVVLAIMARGFPAMGTGF